MEYREHDIKFVYEIKHELVEMINQTKFNQLNLSILLTGVQPNTKTSEKQIFSRHLLTFKKFPIAKHVTYDSKCRKLLSKVMFSHKIKHTVEIFIKFYIFESNLQLVYIVNKPINSMLF